MNKRKAQEEMVGFALIMIIVAVIIMVFIGISFSKPKKEEIGSYEVESFLQALLQHNTDCEDNFRALDIRDAIFECRRGGNCIDGRDVCDVLNNTVKSIINEFWKVQEGYSFRIFSEEEEILSISLGNSSRSYQEGIQPFSRSGETLYVSFRAYS